MITTNMPGEKEEPEPIRGLSVTRVGTVEGFKRPEKKKNKQ